MLQPVRRRTWAPRGQTPIQRSWDRHDRLSVVAALSVSPVQRRLGLFFQVYGQNIRSEQVVEVLRALHRQLRRKFLLVLDRFNVHRKAVRVLQTAHPGWFEPEWLPAYAPELNPVEHIWNHSKYSDLANFIPDDIDDLCFHVKESLWHQQADPGRLYSCFRYAQLAL